jgi:hypothetical protein
MWQKCHQGTGWNFVISRAQPGRENPLVTSPGPRRIEVRCRFYCALAINGSQPRGTRELVAKVCEAESVVQSRTRFFLWTRAVKDKLHEDSQDARVLFPCRGFLLKSQMQSEGAVGVRLTVYWPY